MSLPSCILLSPVTKIELQVACIQAEAALLSGYEQAYATKFAGWLTIGAASGALLAGWMALHGTKKQIEAVRAAREEERKFLRESKSVEVSNYHRFVGELLRLSIVDVASIRSIVNWSTPSHNEKMRSTRSILVLVDEFNTSNWVRHQLLGADLIIEIYRYNALLREFVGKLSELDTLLLKKPPPNPAHEFKQWQMSLARWGGNARLFEIMDAFFALQTLIMQRLKSLT